MSDERSLNLGISYIISIILLVFAVSSVGIRAQEYSYIVFYVSGSVEVSVLIALRTYSIIPGFATKYSKHFSGFSEYFFPIFSAVFVYVISQEITSVFSNQIYVIYLVPTVPTALFIIPIFIIVARVGEVKKIKVDVGPPEVMVFDENSGNTTLYIFIHNSDKKENEFHFEASLPEGVIANDGERNYNNSLTGDFTLDKNKERSIEFFLRHEARINGLRKLTFFITWNGNQIERDVILNLRYPTGENKDKNIDIGATKNENK